MTSDIQSIETLTPRFWFRSWVVRYLILGILVFAAAKVSASNQSALVFDLSAVTVLAAATLFLAQNKLVLFLYANIFLFVHMLTFQFQYSLGAGFMPRQHLKSEFDLTVAAVVMLHFVFLVAGSQLSRRGPRREYVAPFMVQKSKLVWGVIIATCVIVAAILTFGWEFLTASRVETLKVFTNLAGTQVLFLYVLKALPYMLLLALLDYRLNRGGGLGVSLAIGVLLVFTLYFSNPSNTPRFICLTAMIVIGVYLVARAEWISLKFAAITAPFLMLVFLPITSLMRRPEFELTLGNWRESFNTLEFSSVQLLADGIEMVQGADCCGNRTLSAILILFPRQLWPAKSTGSGAEIANANFYISDNVAVPPFFDFFADYGFFGLVVLSLFSGLILAKVMLPGLGAIISFYSRRTMYSLMLFSLVPIMARGDFGTFTICLYTFAITYELVRFLTSGRIFSVERRQHM